MIEVDAYVVSYINYEVSHERKRRKEQLKSCNARMDEERDIS